MGDQAELRSPEEEKRGRQPGIELVIFPVLDDAVVVPAAEDRDDQGGGLAPFVTLVENGLHGFEFLGLENEDEPPGLIVRTRRSEPGVKGQVMNEIKSDFNGVK
jgi:hypothetical protein